MLIQIKTHCSQIQPEKAKLKMKVVLVFILLAYAFHGTDGQFTDFTPKLLESYVDIPTKGASDWEPFQIGSDTYLAVANYYDGSSRGINSVIYKWDGSTFVSHQTIRVNSKFAMLFSC